MLLAKDSFVTLNRMFLPAAVLVLAGCATGGGSTGADTAADHAHDHHMGHSSEPDELGRQLYDMKHEMSPESIAEMRARNIFPPGTTDEAVQGMMRSMGPNYAWYISSEDMKNKRGVLILAHGFGEHGDMTMRDRMQPVGEELPTAFAFGMSMAMSDHIQVALDDLTAAGANEVVVIPAASSRYSTLMRQWEYIFNLRDEPAYATVPKVSTNAKVVFGSPMENHPIVVDILSDYAGEISEDKAREEIIIVAHGPLDPEDNRKQLNDMQKFADALRAAGYANAYPVTLQDDAPKEVRDANVQNMRKLVDDIHARGNQPMVITNLLGTRMVQRSIRRDLDGLAYRYNFKGLVEHEKFVEWVELMAKAD
jgi:hypothetical protein